MKNKSKRVFYDEREGCWKDWSEAGILEKIKGILCFHGIVILKDGFDSVDLPGELEEIKKEGWREEEILVLQYNDTNKCGIGVERAIFERKNGESKPFVEGVIRDK